MEDKEPKTISKQKRLLLFFWAEDWNNNRKQNVNSFQISENDFFHKNNKVKWKQCLEQCSFIWKPSEIRFTEIKLANQSFNFVCFL